MAEDPRDVEKRLAAERGLDVGALYLRVTGQLMWLDDVDPKARRAQKKWRAFIARHSG